MRPPVTGFPNILLKGGGINPTVSNLKFLIGVQILDRNKTLFFLSFLLSFKSILEPGRFNFKIYLVVRGKTITSPFLD